MRMKKIIITGGHLTPALATIEELKKRQDWNIYYIGRKYFFEGKKVLSEESKIIPKIGINFIPLTTGRLQRKFTFYTIPSLLKIPFGFCQALYYLKKIRPKVILSFGGYISTPVVIAGWLLGVPVVSHEQTMSPGLANRINSRFSKSIAVSFKESLKNFPSSKVVFTGNPIRKEIFEVKQGTIAKALDPVMKKKKLPLIYITGGGQGSLAINKVVTESLPELLKLALVVHQTGALEYEKTLNFSLSFPSELRERYLVKDFISPEDIGWVLNRADLVVSRAGANIVWELGVLGKPAILIPLPIAGGQEQLLNAKVLEKIGLAEVILQKEFTSEKLLEFLKKMLTNLKRYKVERRILNEYFPVNGTEKLIDVVYEALKK